MAETMTWSIRRNPIGYCEVEPMPSDEELGRFYAEKYYQEECGPKRASYDPLEIQHFYNSAREIGHHLEMLGLKTGRLLDIGCGEGWTLKHFHQAGWAIEAVDFSRYALEKWHPELLPYFTAGNFSEHLQSVEPGYDAIILQNVLEHVPDAVATMRQVAGLLSPKGVAVVVVPNDFSALQALLTDEGDIDREFWLAPPEHLNYFDHQTLGALARHCGLNEKLRAATHPIDFDLLAENTNYIRDRSLGRHSYRRGLRIECFLAAQSVAAHAAYHRALADLGVGRNIVGYYQRA